MTTTGKHFTFVCNNCGNSNVYVNSWDRDYDRNIIEIVCDDCCQEVADNVLVNKGK